MFYVSPYVVGIRFERSLTCTTSSTTTIYLLLVHQLGPANSIRVVLRAYIWFEKRSAALW